MNESSVTEAEAALRRVNLAVATLAGGDALCDTVLRKEAITAVTPDSRVRVADLLLFEAASPTHPAHGMCRNVEVELEACQRYLGALAHGYRRVAAVGALTADIMLDVLAVLADIPCSSQRESIAATTADVEAWIGASSTTRVVEQAALVQDRLARLSNMNAQCELLGRIAARLILRSHAPSMSAIVLSRHEPSPCPDASSDAGIIGWFAEDVVERSAEALSLIDRISRLTTDDEHRIATLGKAAHSAHRVLHVMRQSPVIALPRLIDDTGLHVQAVTSALHRLRALGIVREITGRYRHRVYSYDAYVAAIEGDALARRPGAAERGESP